MLRCLGGNVIRLSVRAPSPEGNYFEGGKLGRRWQEYGPPSSELTQDVTSVVHCEIL